MEAPPGQSLAGGPSSAFDGDVAAWSPEHLLLSSLGLCLLTTFEAFAARDGIELLDWRASAHGTVERTPEGLQFTSIVLGVDMEIAGNVERVEGTLEDAKRYCLVMSSLRIPVVVEAQVRTPDGAAVELPDEDAAGGGAEPRDDEDAVDVVAEVVALQRQAS